MEPISKEKLMESFKSADQDKDGLLNSEQLLHVLTTLGRNIYKPSLLKDMRKIKTEKWETVNFEEFYDYFMNTRTKLKKQLWKMKKQIQNAVKDFQQTFKDKDMKTIKDRETSGRIKIIIGDNVPYHSQINAHIIKDTKKITKIPIIKVRIYTQTEQNCSILEDLFIKLAAFAKDMVTGEQPELQEDVDLLDVKVRKEIKEKFVEVQIQCRIPQLMDSQSSYTNFIDEILQNKVDANIVLKYQTNNSLEEVFEEQSQATFGDFLSKNSSLELGWETGQFISPLKEFLLATQILSDFQYDKTNISCLLLLALTNSENLRGTFEFDNSEWEDTQNNEFYNELKGLVPLIFGSSQEIVMMSNDLDLGENSVKNLFTMIDDKLHVTVEFGCFYVDLKLQVKGLNKVTRKFLEMAEENFGDSEY